MGIVKGWRKWRKEEQAIKELQKLTDKELFDIGINRSMIRQAVKGLSKQNEE